MTDMISGKAAEDFLQKMREQKVVIDEPVLTKDQNKRVLEHIGNLHEEYKRLYSTMVEAAHGAEDFKKKKIHRMIDHVVDKQKELDHFHKNFRK
jgi:hypothetical protein